MVLCKYGCKREALFQFKSGTWCCENSHSKCPVNKKKNSDSHKGKKNGMYGKQTWNKGKTKENCSSIKSISVKNSENHRKGILKNYLPSWKGKKHTEETKKKIAKKLEGNNHGLGRGKVSYYKGIKLKSTWELAVAYHLDQNKIEWKYEEKIYKLDKGTYRPDFFIYYKNKFVKLIEVKGFFRKENKEKFEEFLKKYPEIKVELWDYKILRYLSLIKTDGTLEIQIPSLIKKEQ